MRRIRRGRTPGRRSRMDKGGGGGGGGGEQTVVVK